LDLGDRRIGIAVSDPLLLTAQGLQTYERKEPDADMDYITALVEQYTASIVVIGLPVNMNGTMGPRALISKDFGESLQQRITAKIDYWDERLSTASAERMLIQADVSRKKRKKVIDKMAAVNILQGYLDYLSNRKVMEGMKNGRE
jgi:putative holliday junction resolvase